MTRAFTLALPGAWERVDLTRGTSDVDRVGRALVSLATLSQQPTVRRSFEDDVRPRLDAFAEHGVTTVVFPVVPVLDLPVRPFISFRPLPAAEGDPLVYVKTIAGSDDNAEPWSSESMTGLRSRRQVDVAATGADRAEPAASTPDESVVLARLDVLSRELEIPDDLVLRSLHVDYTIGSSESSDDWIDIQTAIQFPNTDEAEGFAAQAVRLVDAMVQTFRWVS